MIEASKRGDWWYGAGASLPKAIQWHVWFEHFQDRISNMQPFERFLVDATMKLQQTLVKLAQRVRQNPGWATPFGDSDMADIKALAEEPAAWYRKNRPDDDRIRNLDPVLLMLYHGLDGAYAVIERFANELDQINRRGYVLVDSAAESREVLG